MSYKWRTSASNARPNSASSGATSSDHAKAADSTSFDWAQKDSWAKLVAGNSEKGTGSLSSADEEKEKQVLTHATSETGKKQTAARSFAESEEWWTEWWTGLPEGSDEEPKCERDPDYVDPIVSRAYLGYTDCRFDVFFNVYEDELKGKTVEEVVDLYYKVTTGGVRPTFKEGDEFGADR